MPLKQSLIREVLIMNKIKKLTVVNGDDSKSYSVGYGSPKISSIQDKTQEFENKMEYMYFIYSNEKLVASVENCPVIVEYQTEDTLTVRVVSSRFRTYWYGDQIGELFTVVKNDNGNYRVVGGKYDAEVHLLNKDDVEIIK